MVRRPQYQPQRGDIVYMDFTAHAGSEQGGRRPALILSPQDFNIATGMAIVCPITTQIKGSPWEVALPRGVDVRGAVLSSHVRSADWLARGATFHAKATDEVVAEVLARVEAIITVE
jgi:mRNA interferase MazF